ncbi:hypothetical protein T11_7234 [Trichinella zimbabwensis]|uniref:Uncharacterized protein n=1 Tax=Trichinella zimbabwensis TaxID=268475 RepID=A0A0V1GW73_9BILA|nr:hypothetical protein T11_7234 [Trichinella zimbabwensis]
MAQLANKVAETISQLPIKRVQPISEQPITKRGRSLGKRVADEFSIARRGRRLQLPSAIRCAATSCAEGDAKGRY